MENQQSVLVSIKRILLIVGILIGSVALFFLIRNLATLFLMIFAGILLGVLFDGLAGFVSDHTPLNRGISLTLVLVSLVAVVFLIAWLRGPSIVDQVADFKDQFSNIIKTVEQELKTEPWGKPFLELFHSSGNLFKGKDNIFYGITGVVSSILGVIGDVFVVILIGVYLSIDMDLYRRGILYLFPSDKREHAREVLASLGTALRSWLWSRFLAMVSVGILTAIGLVLIGLPLAFFLGLITAIFTFIPFIGPILAAIPATLVGLSQSPEKALLALLVYTIIQILENDLITPLIQQWVTDLPPVLLIAVQIVFGVIFGYSGLILATPITVVIVVLIQKLYVNETLGENVKLLGEPKKKKA
jgi:predicted PurR-regulated permease PerM